MDRLNSPRIVCLLPLLLFFTLSGCGSSFLDPFGGIQLGGKNAPEEKRNYVHVETPASDDDDDDDDDTPEQPQQGDLNPLPTPVEYERKGVKILVKKKGQVDKDANILLLGYNGANYVWHNGFLPPLPPKGLHSYNKYFGPDRGLPDNTYCFDLEDEKFQGILTNFPQGGKQGVPETSFWGVFFVESSKVAKPKMHPLKDLEISYFVGTCGEALSKKQTPVIRIEGCVDLCGSGENAVSTAEENALAYMRKLANKKEAEQVKMPQVVYAPMAANNKSILHDPKRGIFIYGPPAFKVLKVKE